MTRVHGAADVLTVTPSGLYCAAGDFHIDPTRRVSRALITHGHSDHARPGHGQVLATQGRWTSCACVSAKHSPGRASRISYGRSLRIGDAHVTFAPAGHVLGSAQNLCRRAWFPGLPCPRLQTLQPIRPAGISNPSGAMPLSPKPRSGLPVFRHPDHERNRSCSSRSACSPSGRTSSASYSLRKGAEDEP